MVKYKYPTFKEMIIMKEMEMELTDKEKHELIKAKRTAIKLQRIWLKQKSE